MGARGPRSASSLSVIGPSGVVSTERPRPPAELTAEQAEVWRAICNEHPAEWLTRGAFPLLVQYSRHVVSARRLAQLIERCEQAEEFDAAEHARLLRLQETETRAISSLAVRLGFALSTYKERDKKAKRVAKKPWEDAEA